MNREKGKRPAGYNPAHQEEDRTDENRRIVAVDESSAGTIGYDELGQPRWTWITEIDGAAKDEEDTFNYLKALSNDDLALADEQGATERDERNAAPTEGGYNPYDTCRIKIKGKFPR